MDTAVKIGLGALISGASAYGLARMNYSRELLKEFTKRRRDTLESIAETVQLSHKRYAEAVLLYSNVMGHRNDVRQLPAAEFDDVLKGMKDLMMDLFSTQSRLQLLGEERAAQLVEDFLNNWGEVMDLMGEEKQVDFSGLPAGALELKGQILRELSRAYRR